MVIAVLAILSGLVLPKLDVFKLKANKATAAANMAGVNRFVESFKVQKDVYPDKWDSLLDAATLNSLFTELDPQLTGSLPATPKKLTTTTLATDNELRSLIRVGVTQVMDHTTGGFPGNSATTVPRTLAVNDTIATIDPNDGDGLAILAGFYPDVVNPTPANLPPAGLKVAVFGLGPRNQMIGNTLYSAPFYANTDQLKYYNRFLVCYEIKTDGSRARLLGTLGADADPIGDELIDFYEN